MKEMHDFQGTLDDSEILHMLNLSLDDYFHLVVLKYQRRMLAYAFRNLQHWHDAQDIVQEAFIKAYQSLSSFPEERIIQLKLAPWLFTIIYNLCVNKRSRNHFSYASIDQPETRKQFEDTENGQDRPPEDVVIPAQALEELCSLLHQLPDDYREAIMLYYIGGLTDSEVAEVRNKPRDTVKSHRQRGLQKMRALFSRREEGRSMTKHSIR